MVVGFFELRFSGLGRFPQWLSPYIYQNDNDVELVLFYEQDDLEDKEKIIQQLPEGVKIVKVDSISKKSIIELLASHKLERLVVMAQRIPDSCFIAAAKSLGIKTIMYQHGLYIPFMKRESSLFINNIYKSYRFFKYAITTASIVGESRLNTLNQYIKVYLLGHNAVKVGLPYKKLNVDKVMVYGEYWKEYHHEQYGYEIDEQVVVGTPDFNDLDLILDEAKDTKSVCYIAQTLVEDGRLPRDLMETFISNLNYAATTLGIRVFVRLHPRSDMSLYSALEDNADFSKTEFPDANIYLGHYSSIIAKATFFSDNIILADFPGHEIPKYIEMLHSFKLNYNEKEKLVKLVADSLRKGIESDMVSSNIKKQNLYFDSSVREPLNTAALEVLK